MDRDLLIYSIENALAQLPAAPKSKGVYELRFYSNGLRPMKQKTDLVEVFFYFPSGGTIRDRSFNIIFYEPGLDIYKGFKLKRPVEKGE
jgi:hypothetical protein